MKIQPIKVITFFAVLSTFFAIQGTPIASAASIARPRAPTNLTATAITSSSVTLKWRDRSTVETRFKIERRGINGLYRQIATVPANVTTFTDTKLSPKTVYFYRVRASNERGNSLYYSNRVYVVTHAAPPAKPPTLPPVTPPTPPSVTIPPPPVAIPPATVPPVATIPPPSTPPVPVTGHPRLLLTANDLPRLRAWAVDSNPMYENGLKPLAEKAKGIMDAKKLDQDNGSGTAWDQYPNEMYAELFAFMSLVAPSQTERDDYGVRARNRLMYVIDKAALGAAPGQPFRDPNFSVHNRSRWWGDGFALTVDWAYPYLSTADKTKIRQVFLRWIDENIHAGTTTNNHPEPIGLVNDPALLTDQNRVRWAGNNYFTAHMRNIGLMSMSLDGTDDPNGTLSTYLKNATGAWLYMTDHLMKTDIKGGLPAEGYEYSPQAMGYVAQFLLALKTAGKDNPTLYGPQVVLTNNSYWKDAINAFAQSNSPTAKLSRDTNDQWMGPLYDPAWYGDGAHDYTPDFMGVFGPLGLYDEKTGNTNELQGLRWIEKNMPPGGSNKLLYRIAGTDDYLTGIWYYLLFDPKATEPTEPTDPRSQTPLDLFAAGLGRILSRTNWSADASWFTYKLGWNSVDHQHSDGNMFEFYRKGEWLTKERTGYGDNVASTDYKNGIAIHNDAPSHNDSGGYRNVNWLRGSQWLYVNDGDGKILAKSLQKNYVYALGDATNLYNSTYEGATDVKHASRSILWLKPDDIVVYDRAESKSPNQFKRFWLNLPSKGTVVQNRMTMSTASGQTLSVTSLLPTNKTMGVEPAEDLDYEPADNDPITYRLKIEANGAPTSARFLTVLHGADAGATTQSVTLIQSSSGTAFDGAITGSVSAMFPVDLSATFSSVSYSVPAAVGTQYVTGLTPNATYAIKKTPSNGNIQITITPGGSTTADEGGVLVF